MAYLLGLLLTTLIGTVSSKLSNPLPVIEPFGSKFFDADGNQFFIRGGSSVVLDGLANGEQCKLDAPLMKELGANVIRVYTVDPENGHDTCMQAFNDVGIYVIIDLPTPIHSINRANWSWNIDLYDSYTQSFDAFAEYDNLLAVNVGNEAVNDIDTAEVALYIKAAARDVKAFRNARGYRKIPVGYSSADVSAINPMIQYYLSCGGNPNETVDFFAYNDYGWVRLLPLFPIVACGDSSMSLSGYNTMLKYGSKSNIPIFFSEEGCNTESPREFTDQDSIFGPDMSDVWSGTVIYEWAEEANDYGLVDYNETQADQTVLTTATTPLPRTDYSNLSKRWATLTPKSVKKSNYKPSIPTPVCPSSTDGGWPIDPSIGPPTIAGLEISTVARVTTLSPTASSTGKGASNDASRPAASASASSSSALATTSPDSPSSGGLSSTTKIALGVAIPVAVILLAAIAFFVIRRRRSKRAPVYKDIPVGEKPELGGIPVSQLESRDNQIKVNREELDSRPVRRMQTDGQAWELPGDEGMR